ncbi:type IV secretion protein DotB, partial [Pseudomonas sp. SIMBA_059]
TVDGKRTAARSWLRFTEQVRDTLMDLTDMGRVTQRVAEFVRDEGHTFAAEADRLLAAGLITEATARDLRHG